MRSSLALALAALLAAACSAPPPSCAGLAGAPMLSATLYFGRTSPAGGMVDETAWQRFLADAVTPRFPAGFTALAGSGQWRRSDGRIAAEPSTVLVVIAPRGPDTLAALAAIRAEYRSRFHQESVGLAVRETCAAF